MEYYKQFSKCRPILNFAHGWEHQVMNQDHLHHQTAPLVDALFVFQFSGIPCLCCGFVLPLDVESLSYSLPEVPTDQNFDSLFEAFEDFPSSSGSDLVSPVSSVSPGYQVGLYLGCESQKIADLIYYISGFKFSFILVFCSMVIL